VNSANHFRLKDYGVGNLLNVQTVLERCGRATIAQVRAAALAAQLHVEQLA